MNFRRILLTSFCICACAGIASADDLALDGARSDLESSRADSIELPENIDFFIFGGEVVGVCGADLSSISLENGLMFTSSNSYPLTCSAKEITVSGCVDATGDMSADMTGACAAAKGQAGTGSDCPAENGSCARCTGGEPPYSEGTCKYKDGSVDPGDTCSNYRVENGDEGQQVCADVSASCKYRCKK